MSHEPKLTPASGMPAASLLERAKREDDEIRAPRSAAKSETGEILRAIESLREEHRTSSAENRAAVLALEKRFNEHAESDHRHFGSIESQLKDQRDDHKRLGDEVVKLASAMTGCAAAAARAADHALEAKQLAGRTEANVRDMVESAMRMHNSSIASSVSDAVKPFADKVDEIESSQAKANEALGAVVEELGIEDRVQLGRDVKPHDKPPVRSLKTTARDSKAAAVGGTLTFCILVVELVLRLLSGH